MTRKQWKKKGETDSFGPWKGSFGRQGGAGTRQGVKIRALRERLIKGCKLTSGNDAAA